MTKCRCGKDHRNEKPVDPKKIMEDHAKQMADDLDRRILQRLGIKKPPPKEVK